MDQLQRDNSLSIWLQQHYSRLSFPRKFLENYTITKNCISSTSSFRPGSSLLLRCVNNSLRGHCVHMINFRQLGSYKDDDSKDKCCPYQKFVRSPIWTVCSCFWRKPAIRVSQHERCTAGETFNIIIRSAVRLSTKIEDICLQTMLQKTKTKFYQRSELLRQQNKKGKCIQR